MVVFGRNNGAQFAVLFGSLTAAGVLRLDILLELGWQTFNEVTKLFVAQSTGHTVDTGKDLVQVTHQEVAKGEVRCSIANISIVMKPSFIDFLMQQTQLGGVINTIGENGSAVRPKNSDPCRDTKSFGIRNIFKNKTKACYVDE